MGAAGLFFNFPAGGAVPGLAYFCDFDQSIPMAVNVVKVDRANPDLKLFVTLGGGNQIGTATLSQQATFVPPSVGTAVAGINGDYFNVLEPYFGDPMNLQIMNGGELVSAPAVDRAFFYLDAKGQPHITNIVTEALEFKVIWPDGRTTPLGLNQTPLPGQAILYTRVAGINTRMEGVDLILGQHGNDPWLPLRIGQTLVAEVKAINKNGYSKVSADIAVLSLSPRQLSSLPELKPGMVVKLATTTTPSILGATLAIGGGPTLVREGKVRTFDGIAVRHPRTAFGWNSQFYYLVQVDGRQARRSMGMSYRELADYFVTKLKCTDALNLDGGGSATMWVTGRVVNSPSQGRERPAANALFVITGKK
jgi:hypothetical protein